MLTIGFAASKGGVGKTTLAACVSVAAAASGRVALFDGDPQKSFARWHELRGSPANPALLDGTLGIEAAAKKAERDGFDWLVADSGPGTLTRIAPVIECANLVVIPVRPSPLDLEAIEPVTELCHMFKKRFVFVLNANPARSSLTSGAIDYLKQEGPVLDVLIGNRTSYPGAMITGKTAPEIERGGKADEEITELWRQIRKLAASEKKLVPVNSDTGRKR